MNHAVQRYFTSHRLQMHLMKMAETKKTTLLVYHKALFLDTLAKTLVICMTMKCGLELLISL